MFFLPTTNQARVTGTLFFAVLFAFFIVNGWQTIATAAIVFGSYAKICVTPCRALVIAPKFYWKNNFKLTEVLQDDT